MYHKYTNSCKLPNKVIILSLAKFQTEFKPMCYLDSTEDDQKPKAWPLLNDVRLWIDGDEFVFVLRLEWRMKMHILLLDRVLGVDGRRWLYWPRQKKMRSHIQEFKFHKQACLVLLLSL